MHFKGNFPVMSALLMLFVTQACHAQMMCYVCDDCAQITKDTPQFMCDASFFTSGGTTLPSTMITTEDSTTPMATSPSTFEMSSSSSTTMAPTTTEAATTMESSTTVDTTSAESTEAPLPTPPTIGPPMTTTVMPTPTNQGTVIVPVDTATVKMNAMELAENATAVTPLNNLTKAYVPSSELRVRQRRSLMQTDISYHCYRVQRSDNGTMVVDRSCSRVTAKEGVCSQLESVSNSTEKLNKCFACSTKLCNGSSALSVSVVAVLVGVVAALMRN